jgi:hypothetical protein
MQKNDGKSGLGHGIRIEIGRDGLDDGVLLVRLDSSAAILYSTRLSFSQSVS